MKRNNGNSLPCWRVKKEINLLIGYPLLPPSNILEWEGPRIRDFLLHTRDRILFLLSGPTGASYRTLHRAHGSGFWYGALAEEGINNEMEEALMEETKQLWWGEGLQRSPLGFLCDLSFLCDDSPARMRETVERARAINLLQKNVNHLHMEPDGVALIRSQMQISKKLGEVRRLLHLRGIDIPTVGYSPGGKEPRSVEYELALLEWIANGGRAPHEISPGGESTKKS